MQRVVRSTFAGLLILAGLTACGDKVTVPGLTTTTPPNAVHSVTVTPASATLNQAVTGTAADKITLAVSVDADAGVTDRTVTWASANSAIASVDQAGVVTAGTTAGTTTITASSKVAPDVKGAALITVVTAGTGAPATVSISTINQTVCVVGGACTSVPANLGNVLGQIDVTFNVDPGSAKLNEVDMIMNCTGNGNSGTDTVVAKQTLAPGNIIPSEASEASSAPVTLSFNTGSFNGTTGAVAFRNGGCTLKGKAITSAGTTVASNALTLTLNNADVIVGSVSAAKSAINSVTGLVWNGGDVTVTETPIMYSGRVPGTTVVTFAGVVHPTSQTGAGQKTFLFNDSNGATLATGSADINQITNAAAAATISMIDGAGQAFTTNPCGVNVCTQTSVLAGAAVAPATIRLDTQRPNPGNLALNPNVLQNTATSWVGTNFRFVADSASGFAGPDSTAAAATCAGGLQRVCNLDNNGVDNVTVAFFFNTTGSRTAGAATLITSGGALSETVAATTNTLDMITSDALGNVDTSFATTVAGTRNAANSAFGVDKTAPAITVAGVTNQATSQTVGGTGPMTSAITDGLSGPQQQQLVAQVILNATVNSATLPANQTVGTVAAPGTVNGGCIVGRFNRTSGAANADVDALPVFDKTGAQIGTCSPTPIPNAQANTLNTNVATTSGYVTSRIVAIDQAGNRAAAQTFVVAEDNSSPTVGALDLPTSITGGSAPVIPAPGLDNLDVTQDAVVLNYAGVGLTFQFPLVSGPGTAFDNVLTPGSTTTGATMSPTVPFFARNLQNNPGAVRPSTPTQVANGPGNIQVGAIDEVGRTGVSAAVNLTTTTTVAQPTANPWASDFTGGTAITATNVTLSNCPLAGCTGGAAPANPTSTVFTVTATGVTSTFANPFARVEVWYQVNGAGSWIFAGSSTTGSSRDTGVGGNRFWDFTVSFTPLKLAPRDVITGSTVGLTSGATLSVVGIGLTANGDGIVTAPLAVTLTNP